MERVMSKSMNEWRPTITVICTVVLAFAALAALMQFEHAEMRAEIGGLRTEMRAEIGSLRTEMRAEHDSLRTEMHAEHESLRAEMHAEHESLRAEHVSMRGEHDSLRAEINAQFDDIRARINSIDRRTARIEGHLFGIDIAADRPTTE